MKITVTVELTDYELQVIGWEAGTFHGQNPKAASAKIAKEWVTNAVGIQMANSKRRAHGGKHNSFWAAQDALSRKPEAMTMIEKLLAGQITFTREEMARTCQCGIPGRLCPVHPGPQKTVMRKGRQ